MLAIVPFIMIVVGALMYALCTNAKLAEIGRLVLASGLLAFAFTYAGKVISVIR